MSRRICVECWEEIPDEATLNEHAERHMVGTDNLWCFACPKECGPKDRWEEPRAFHPAHNGRCNMPTGRLGVVSCYCTAKPEGVTA